MSVWASSQVLARVSTNSVSLIKPVLRMLLRQPLKVPLNSEHMSQESDVIFLQWAEHYAALTRLAVGQTLMVNQLVDMEWKFGGKEEQTQRARPI